MKKNELIRYKDGICRVLAVSEDRILVIDCLKQTMPVWIDAGVVSDIEIIPEENYFNYNVVSGDSLYSIARQFDTTIDAIKNINNLTSNLLNIGQILKIPTTSTSEKTYVVKSGDSLYSIAKNFNLTVDELKRLNNLTSNLLNIGQILIIE